MAVDRSAEVKVLGLRELARGFKQIEAGLPSALKAELLPVAKHMAGVVQQRMPFVTGTAAASVKARSSTSGASIAAGGRAAPYFPWLNFGGSTGRGHVTGEAGSGAIKRALIKPDRYLYAAISEGRKETAEAALEAVARVAKKLAFEVRG